MSKLLFFIIIIVLVIAALYYTTTVTYPSQVVSPQNFTDSGVSERFGNTNFY